MHPFTGLMEGHCFSADKPVVVIGRSAAAGMKTFENKIAAWNYIEATSRHNQTARFFRVYELQGERWERIPALPTYLQRLQEAHAFSQCLSFADVNVA
jgi:hypothetical protein